jgi:hypothetical protein
VRNWRLWPGGRGHPISIDIKDGENVQRQKFDDMTFLTGDFRNQGRHLYLDAWVITLRFEYLPDENWLYRKEGEGFYVRNWKVPKGESQYTPLHLQRTTVGDEDFAKRLKLEEWRRIIIGGRERKEHPTALICDWKEKTASRIGIVFMNQNVKSRAGVVEPIQYPRRWCTDIRFE